MQNRGRGAPAHYPLLTAHYPLPTLPVPSLDCAYFPSPRGCTLSLAPPTAHYPLPTFCPPFVFILLQIPFPATSFVSHPYKSPRGLGLPWSVNSPLATHHSS